MIKICTCSSSNIFFHVAQVVMLLHMLYYFYVDALLHSGRRGLGQVLHFGLMQ